MSITLTNDFAEVTLGPITLSNNTWGIDTWGFDHWVNGRDYTQSVTYTPGNLTQNLRFDWSYTNPNGHILAYPELILGYKPWSQAGDRFLVGRVEALRELTVTTEIDIRGDTDGYNIAYDLWLTDKPAGGPDDISGEVMVWLHPGGFTAGPKADARLVTADFSASVYYEPNMDAGTDQTWTYVAVVIDGGYLDGTLDMAAILRFLANHGFIDRNDYLSAVELGAEVQTGTGGFDLHSFDWQHSQYNITEGKDRLFGTAATDRILGKGGDDLLSGRGGNDRLYGGEGRDSLFGGQGADRLIGGLGADRLTGGDGADLFVYARAAAAKGDRIRDFSHSEGDRIDLSGFDLDWTFIGKQGFHKVAGELRFDRIDSHLRLSADIDGNGTADFSLIVESMAQLTLADFIL